MTVATEAATAPPTRMRRGTVLLLAGIAVVLVAVTGFGAGAAVAFSLSADRVARAYAADAAAHVDAVLALAGSPEDALAEIDLGRVPEPAEPIGSALSGTYRTVVGELAPLYDQRLDALRDAITGDTASGDAARTPAEAAREVFGIVISAVEKQPSGLDGSADLGEWQELADAIPRVGESVAVIEEAATRLEEDPLLTRYPSAAVLADDLRDWAGHRDLWALTMAGGIGSLSDWTEEALSQVADDLGRAVTTGETFTPRDLPVYDGEEMFRADLADLTERVEEDAQAVMLSSTALTEDVEADPEAHLAADGTDTSAPDTSAEVEALTEVGARLATHAG